MISQRHPAHYPGDVARIALMCALIIPPLAAPAAAQPADEAPDDVIVVTGTRIPRKDQSAPSPVVSFDRKELTAFGSTVVEDFLNTAPQATPDFGRGTNNPGDGSASIDLRGLGRGRTLVLFNGRRLAPTGTGGAIDVNAIPAAMIARVELVSGGASAVYGSDAVAGAVNFISRDDFEGIEANGQYDVFGAGDGAVWNGNIVAGTAFAGGRGHATVFVDYLNRAALFAGAREFTAVTLTEDRTTGDLFPAGNPVGPAGAIFNPRISLGGPPVSLAFEPGGTVHPFGPADFYNFAQDNYIQTPLTRWSSGLIAKYDASDDVELFLEFMYSRPDSAQQLAPTPGRFTSNVTLSPAFFPASTIAILAPAIDADMDGIARASFTRRFNEVGPRVIERNRQYYRAVAGLKARLSPS